MGPRVVCYLRVSTSDQNADSQEAQLKEYCQRRGWDRVGWFSDVGSGANHDRGALKVIMDEVRAGTVDIVLAWKIDRLARSLNHLAQIIAELQTHNVALVCPSQGIDTTDGNPCAQFQLNILVAVAQFERELIRERVNAGIAAAKQRGLQLGRPSKFERNLALVLPHKELGLSQSEISRATGIPYSTTGEILRHLDRNSKTSF